MQPAKVGSHVLGRDQKAREQDGDSRTSAAEPETYPNVHIGITISARNGKDTLLTIIQSRHVVRKHTQQIAKADSRQDQHEPEEEEFARFDL